MGAVFAVPLWRAPRAPAGAGVLAELPGTTIALTPGGGPPLSELWRSGIGGWNENAGVRGGVTLIVGAEREGLPADLTEAADLTAHIPIRTDSLNAAMAAAIALYEASRIRRTP
jgi:TrmH family RNA methyltransferase